MNSYALILSLILAALNVNVVLTRPLPQADEPPSDYSGAGGSSPGGNITHLAGSHENDGLLGGILGTGSLVSAFSGKQATRSVDTESYCLSPLYCKGNAGNGGLGTSGPAGEGAGGLVCRGCRMEHVKTGSGLLGDAFTGAGGSSPGGSIVEDTAPALIDLFSGQRLLHFFHNTH